MPRHDATPAGGAESSAGTSGGDGSAPLSRLRGLTPAARAALARRGVATCARLLEAAGPPEARADLAREAGLDPGELLALVRRADMARVEGLGTIPGLLLEEVGVADVAALAGAAPVELHARLRALNEAGRITRRPPDPREVAAWVARARELPPLVVV